MILSVDEDYNVSAPVVVHPDMKFAVANDSANNIKVTSNNLSEFEKNSNGELVIEGFGGNDKISGKSGNDYIDGGVDAGYRDWETDRKSTRLNSSHITRARMPSSA